MPSEKYKTSPLPVYSSDKRSRTPGDDMPPARGGCHLPRCRARRIVALLLFVCGGLVVGQYSRAGDDSNETLRAVERDRIAALQVDGGTGAGGASKAPEGLAAELGAHLPALTATPLCPPPRRPFAAAAADASACVCAQSWTL